MPERAVSSANRFAGRSVGQEKRAVAIEQEREHETQCEGRVAEQLQIHQRMAAAALDAPLGRHEYRERGHGQREHHEGPRRPAGFTAVRHRIDDQQQHHREQPDALQVDAGTRGRLIFRHELPGADEGHDADRNIDEKDDAPVEPERVIGDQRAAAQLAHDRRQSEDETVEAHHFGLPMQRHDRTDSREHLRRHDRGRDALHDPRDHQACGRWWRSRTAPRRPRTPPSPS
jgi:hypothetical protein